MDCPYRVTIHDRKLAEQTKNYVKIGHYFVFAEERNTRGHKQKISGRLARLLIQKADKVFPLADKALTLEGLTITPIPKAAGHIGCMVSDRDIYRAEQDNVRLFIASLSSCSTLNLTIFKSPSDSGILQGSPLFGPNEMPGGFSVSRTVELADGVAMETFSGLEPGEYSAQADINGSPLGRSIFFTVAEDKAAALRVHLINHKLNRASGTLSFSLTAESFRMPFTGSLIAALTEKDKILTETILRPISPGYYEGKIGIRAQGTFRLRLTAADDPERMTEIPVSGPKKSEEEASVLNELGTEFRFSTLAEPEALPICGGWLTRGDFLPTPLIVEEIVTDKPVIHAAAAVESLVLISLDLVSGKYSIQEAGDLKTGAEIRVRPGGPMSMVFAGCFVSGRPFEGYTGFISPSRLRVSAEVPAILGPGQNLRVKLKCEGAEGRVPVLLRVSDKGFAPSDNPSSALGVSFKRCIDTATSGMAESEIRTPVLPDESDESLTDELPAEKTAHIPEAPESDEDTLVLSGIESEYEDIIDLSDELTLSLSEEDVVEEPSENKSEILHSNEPDPEPEFKTMEFNADQMFSALDGLSGEKKTETLIGADKFLPDPADIIKKDYPDSGFPKILFYDIVSVSGTGEVLIPIGDCRGTFVVETFALAGTDWAWHRSVTNRDQRVRVELDLPPAVHPEDYMTGRIRAFSASGKASVSLMRDEVSVKLRSLDKDRVSEDIRDRPLELEFDAVPGTYKAMVMDPVSGESDEAEERVGEPGISEYLTKELILLRKGQSLSPNSDSGIRRLRVIPNLEEKSLGLARDLADCPHHCCTETAAKISAATFIYLSSAPQGSKAEAEQIILAAVNRLEKMLIPGKGFALYPGENTVYDYGNSLALYYLRALDNLSTLPSLSPNLRQSAISGAAMAERAALSAKMIPDRISSPEEAYTRACAGKNKEDILKFIEEFLVFSDTEVFPAKKEHAVADRASLAYCAAALIALGDMNRGTDIANPVFRGLNAQFPHASPADSSAALMLMRQLSFLEIKAHLRVNGRNMTISEAVQTEDIALLEVIEGLALAEVTRSRKEDWGSQAYGFPVKAEFRNTGGKKIRCFKAGDRADLTVSLPEGYQAGDRVYVSLPACMSRIRGDGKVRTFSTDFEGRNEVRIPVAVCSEIRGRQHFALCIRNIFKEERRASPGILSIADNFIGEKYSGKWHIIESDYTDLPAPGYVTLNPYKASGFKIGRLQGIMDCRIEQCGGSERIEFSWYGKIGTVIAYGRGWAMIANEQLIGRIYIHDGDDSEFVAVRG